MNAEALIGTVLETCTLQQLIGQGGMGAVYLAQQSRPRRQVAVKVLMPAASLKPHQVSAFLERFRRETDAAASLEHPNIVPVYEYGERGGLAYLVMPYVNGGTLRDVMEAKGQMAFTEAVNYVEQMAEALDFAHMRGVIHRDIKPANMLLTQDGRLLLTDFGLVKIISGNRSEQMRLTGAGAPVGTPDYMSPEQVIGEDVDGRSDQYALGVVLFQMLTGTTPFQGETPMQIASQQLRVQPPSPRSFRSDIPEAAEQVLLRAMAKRAVDRFASVREFASAFRSAAIEPASQSNLGLLSGSTGMLTSVGNQRKGSLFDPKWQTSSMLPSISAAQLNAPNLPLTATAAPAPMLPMETGSNFAVPRAEGTGLLSRTGRFPRIGSNEDSSLRPSASADTGAMAAPATMQQPFYSQSLDLSAFGTSNQPEVSSLSTGMQPSLFTQPVDMLQQPFPTANLQQLSPSGQATTTSFSLFNPEQRTSGNTIKLTGPVKVVQVPVAPGQYVTGLLPLQKGMNDPISEPPSPRKSAWKRVVVTVAFLLVLIVGGSSIWLLRTHNSQPSSPTPSVSTSSTAPNLAATTSAEATASALSNIVFSDQLSQNIHNFPTGQQNGKEYFFKNNAYHIVNQGGQGAAVVVQQSFPETTLNYEVTMQEISGDDLSPNNTFGMIFRYNEQTVKGKLVETFYTFEILNENGSSLYRFYTYNSSKSDPWHMVWSGKTGKEFNGGHGAKAINVVKVFANGSAFGFYVNGTKIGKAKDNSYSSGSIGMLVNWKGTEVAFSNMLITKS
jgi:serine/threonine protein kinase